MSLPSYALSIGWITERIEYKLLSRIHKVLTAIQPPYTFITSFPFNVLAELALDPSLLLLGHLLHDFISKNN